jgi:imidazolonepropionase-like amidohydrolase
VGKREVELLVEAGFTPLEAIRVATSNGAEFLGELEKIGTLAPGKAADIVVLQGDSSANIKDIEKVRSSSKTASATIPRSSSVPGHVGLH